MAGLVATYLTAARGRDQVERMTLAGQKHERKMTREAREQDRIAGAYIGLLRMTERIGQWAQLVNPMYQPNPDRPHPDLRRRLTLGRRSERMAPMRLSRRSRRGRKSSRT